MEQKQFEKLVSFNQANIFRFLRYIGADWHVAEDLTQDVFVCAFNEKNKELSPETLNTGKWLRGVARNLFLNYLRKNNKKTVVFTEEYMQGAEAVWKSEYLENDEGEEVIEALRECVEKLSERNKIAIDLRYEKSLGREEIARKLEMTQNGVKTLLRRLRESLAECIRLNLKQEGDV
jgi:RNA polymerase sigma-70 factor (ECF subfamily)